MKNAGFIALLVCYAAVAGRSYGESDLKDCASLLVPANRAMLGVEYAQEAQGLRVKSVVSGGPAERAGLVADDLIVEINGDALLFRDRVAAVKGLNRYRAGQALRVIVHRGGVNKSLELRGDQITCEAAERLDRLLRVAESGGLEVACSTDEDSAREKEYEEGEQFLALLGKFPATGGILVLTAGLGGAPVNIEADVPLLGELLELGSLPDFMQELAGRLGEGESMTFTIKPQPGTIEVTSVPENFWPSTAAQE